MSNLEKENKTSNQSLSLGQEICQLTKNNIRDYAMYIALVMIFIFFTIKTEGVFVQARNIST